MVRALVLVLVLCLVAVLVAGCAPAPLGHPTQVTKTPGVSITNTGTETVEIRFQSGAVSTLEPGRTLGMPGDKWVLYAEAPDYKWIKTDKDEE